jgi:hypothetical protein
VSRVEWVRVQVAWGAERRRRFLIPLNFLLLHFSYLTLMNDNGETRADLKLPDGELGAQVREGHSIL